MAQDTQQKLTDEEIERLIAIAKTPPTPDERFEDKSSVDSWITALDIKPGFERVTPMRAYVAYRRWAKYPINPKDFFRLFKKRFKQRKATRSKDGERAHSIYLLTPAPFISVPKEYGELQAELKNIDRARYEQKEIENPRAGKKE